MAGGPVINPAVSIVASALVGILLVAPGQAWNHLAVVASSVDILLVALGQAWSHLGFVTLAGLGTVAPSRLGVLIPVGSGIAGQGHLWQGQGAGQDQAAQSACPARYYGSLARQHNLDPFPGLLLTWIQVPAFSSVIAALFPRDLLDLADLLLYLAGPLFVLAGTFQFSIQAGFTSDFLDPAFYFVKRAFRLVLGARFHGIAPWKDC